MSPTASLTLAKNLPQLHRIGCYAAPQVELGRRTRRHLRNRADQLRHEAVVSRTLAETAKISVLAIISFTGSVILTLCLYGQFGFFSIHFGPF